METNINVQKRGYTREQIEKYMLQWKEGGQSKISFSKENGLKYYTFISWFYPKKKKSNKNLRGKADAGFSEVKLSKSINEKAFAEIRFQNGCSLHLFQSVSPEFLRSLLFQ